MHSNIVNAVVLMHWSGCSGYQPDEHFGSNVNGRFSDILCNPSRILRRTASEAYLDLHTLHVNTGRTGFRNHEVSF